MTKYLPQYHFNYLAHSPAFELLKNVHESYILEICEVTNETELTLREFWKKYYNILHCLKTIEKA